VQRAVQALTLFLIVVIPGTHGFAQTTPLAPGARVRVSATGHGDKLVATLVEQTSDSVVIAVASDSGTLRSLGLDQVTKLEMWRTRPGAMAKSWLVGTGAGALVGVLIGATTRPPCEGSGWCIGPQDQGDMVATGVVGGAVLGGLIGLVVGATNRHGWVPVELTAIRSDGSGSGMRVAWRLTLPAIRSP
jgi:hypothetical protein